MSLYISSCISIDSYVSSDFLLALAQSNDNVLYLVATLNITVLSISSVYVACVYSTAYDVCET